MSSDKLKSNRRVFAALNMPASIPKYIVRAGSIHKSMSSKERYAASAANLAKLLIANKELAKIQVGCKTQPPTALISDRNTAKSEVDRFLKALQRQVNNLVRDNPQQAKVIIEEADMVVQHFANNKKFKNRALRGPENGSVILYGEGRGYHNWRMSTDNNTWVNLETTSTAKTLVMGLIAEQKYYFQNRRVLTKGKKSPWSQSVDLVVW